MLCEGFGPSEVGLEGFLEKHPILLPAGRRPLPSGVGGFGFRSVVVSSDRDHVVIWGVSCLFDGKSLGASVDIIPIR